MRSQSEVTLTGYMVGSDSITSGDKHGETNGDTVHFNNSNGDLSYPNGIETKNIRSNSCTCSDKGKCVFF